MADKHPNENTPVIIQSSSWKAKTYDSKEEESARQLIKEEVLKKRHEPYYEVRAKIRHDKKGKAESIIAYLLRANTYTADIVEITTDDSYGLVGIKEGPELAEQDEDDDSDVYGASPSFSDCDMVCATPVPHIPTALDAVRHVATIARSVGLRVNTLLGSQASVANYKSALASGVSAFYSVGHGWTGGIVLDDGNLTASWFAQLQERQVSPAVVVFNSCQVFNPPLQPAVMQAGARTYVGGIINLLIGPSEQVTTDFWNRILSLGESMGPALHEAEQEFYPTPGAFGISGDQGPFGAMVKRPALYHPAAHSLFSRGPGLGHYELKHIGLPSDSRVLLVGPRA